MTLTDLRARAVRSERTEVRLNYTDEQLAAFKTDLARVELLREDEEEGFAEMRSQHNANKKELAEEARKLKLAIRRRYVDEERECLLVADFEGRMMEIYDAETGLLVLSRPLRPEERQVEMPFSGSPQAVTQ